jgi:hypothetical protein
MDDATDLSRLHDIVIPPAPAPWPPAPGLILFAALVLCFAVLLSVTLVRSRRRNAYRRAGLRALATARTVHDVSTVLKRVALVAYPRERVAALHGAAWAAFLDGTCSHGTVAGAVAGPSDAPADASQRALAARWVRGHRGDDGRIRGQS